MAKHNKGNRFVAIYMQQPSLTDPTLFEHILLKRYPSAYAHTRIIVDKERGYNTYISHFGQKGGPTILIDWDGKPLLYQFLKE